MDITNFDGVSSAYLNDYATKLNLLDQHKSDSFSDVLNSMLDAVDETNDLQNKAESAEIQFALGESTNTHDLLVAESKAEVALQYTVAVRDKIIDGYKELMQMSV